MHHRSIAFCSTYSDGECDSAKGSAFTKIVQYTTELGHFSIQGQHETSLWSSMGCSWKNRGSGAPLRYALPT